MCMGKSKSNQAQVPVPAPQQPTNFQYVNADTSNGQQKQAAINSATQGNSPASFGSELGAGGAATPQGAV